WLRHRNVERQSRKSTPRQQSAPEKQRGLPLLDICVQFRSTRLGKRPTPSKRGGLTPAWSAGGKRRSAQPEGERSQAQLGGRCRSRCNCYRQRNRPQHYLKDVG